MLHDTTEELNQEMGGVEEEGCDVEEQEGGEAEGADAGSEGGNEDDNENGSDGGRDRKNQCPPLRFHTYKEAVKKYLLQHMDSDMVGRFRNQVTKCYTQGSKLKCCYNQENQSEENLIGK